MTRRLTTVAYDLSPEPDREAFYAGFAADLDEVDRQHLFRPHRISMTRSRRYRYRLRPQASGFYDTAAQAVVTQAARGGHLVREWVAAELSYDAPAGTTLEARLHDGAGASYYWTGAAWAAAGAGDWNTPAEVEDNVAALDPATVPAAGVEWRLATADKRETPVVYGAALGARLGFGARSGDDAATTLSDGWHDDLIHRVLLPWLRSAAPERTDEAVASAAVAVLDYSGGPDGRSAYVIREVTAVYDLTDDPAMRAPLAGTWDAGARTWTPTTPIPAGHRYAARLIPEPTVAYQADRDLFLAGVPQYVLETVERVADGAAAGFELVRDLDAHEALKVDAPRQRTYRATVLVQAEGQVSALAAAEAVERLLSGRGASLLSAGTGMPVVVHGMSELRPARLTEVLAAAGRFDLTLTALEYHGDEEVGAPLVDQGGFQVTVGDGQTVAAP